MKYIVDIQWTVSKSVEVDAKSLEAAENAVWSDIKQGNVNVWDGSFEATDKVKASACGVVDNEGNKNYFC